MGRGFNNKQSQKYPGGSNDEEIVEDEKQHDVDGAAVASSLYLLIINVIIM